MPVSDADKHSPSPGAEARAHFPIFEDRKLAYLDTAASSQKPRSVIERMSEYLSREHANIHRGAYRLSAESTERYELARRRVAAFLRAPSPECVVFTRGTTEAINLVARSCERWFEPGDTILLSLLEHHSNIVPWQLLAERRGLKLEFVEISDHAVLDLQDLASKLESRRPKLVALTALSNAFGSITPLGECVRLARSHGARILVDAAQAAPHSRIDVAALDLDFLAFSGHKLYGPTGIGALYAKLEHLQRMEPFHGGGDMIRSVDVTGSTWAEPPQKFEAGTPAIAEAIALGSAIDFVEGVGLEKIAAHEHALFEKAKALLQAEPGVTIYGPCRAGVEQASILAFNVEGVHPHDLATVGDTHGVCFRAGHHCAMPALKRLGLQSTARVSFGVYSLEEEIAPLLETIRKARKLFA